MDFKCVEFLKIKGSPKAGSGKTPLARY